MGGRGSNSNLGGGSGSGLKTTGLDVTHNGETTRYYFTSKDGQNYYQRGISGTPEPTPLNMSAKEFRQKLFQMQSIKKPKKLIRRKETADRIMSLV